MRSVAAATLVLAVACGSSSGTKPAMSAATPSDPQIAGLEKSMTELLERLDVLNDRITRLEQAGEERAAAARVPPPVRAPGPASSAHSTEGGAAQPGAIRSAEIAEAYRNAIVLFGKGRYPEARTAFQQVFDADPSGQLADNALFWIGETYYAAADFNNAIRYYKRVSDEFGDQNKAPESLYKLALAYEKTSDLALARTTLQEVISRYPYSAPAASAKSELNRIKY